VNQDGWKDTYVMLPGEVTRVIAKFDLPGRYVWHCHILSHEDHDMMRPFEVSNTDTRLAQKKALLQKVVLKDDLQVYPNPFASNTTINFKVSTQSKISIKIFTIEGREINTVFEGEKSPGIYSLSFEGNRLAAGVYLCRMQVNDRVLQCKLIIQR
jgi:spore coat protein A